MKRTNRIPKRGQWLNTYQKHIYGKLIGLKIMSGNIETQYSNSQHFELLSCKSIFKCMFPYCLHRCWQMNKQNNKGKVVAQDYPAGK